MELHQLMEQGEVVTTTFGPLDKYAPANDNIDVRQFGARGRILDESGQSAGFGVGEPRGQYIGLRRSPDDMRSTHEQFDANITKWRADDTPAYRQQQGLEALAELSGFVYLGSPYAKYPAGLNEAERVVSACAGALMSRGIKIYCPIAHGHAVTRQHELPRDWDFWKSQDQPLIDAAAALIVVEMAYWYQSVGLTYEIECFLKAGKPIMYVKPGDLGVEEVAA